MIIWAGFGCSNIISVICGSVYLFTKVKWEDAVAQSTERLRQTIDSAKDIDA